MLMFLLCTGPMGNNKLPFTCLDISDSRWRTLIRWTCWILSPRSMQLSSIISHMVLSLTISSERGYLIITKYRLLSRRCKISLYYSLLWMMPSSCQRAGRKGTNRNKQRGTNWYKQKRVKTANSHTNLRGIYKFRLSTILFKESSSIL